MDGFVRLRAALADAALRERGGASATSRAGRPIRRGPSWREQLRASAGRALALFAGAERAKADAASTGGWQAIAEFMEANVPEAERARAGEVLVRILNGALFELANLSREQAGLRRCRADEKTQALHDAGGAGAVSDAHFYPAPVAVAADGLQAGAGQRVPGGARARARTSSTWAALLLILGVFAMLYVRERRLWVWLAPATDGARHGGDHGAVESTARRMDSRPRIRAGCKRQAARDQEA